MTAAIILVILVLLGLGIVINGLLRLRRWLNDSPPGGQADEPADYDD